jgi:site-specific DNA-adenine methylase
MNNFFKKSSYDYKLFSYMGGKFKYRKEINNIIQRSNKEIYVELFLGSGAIFLNLEKKFNEYHLAEKDSCLLNCFYQIIHNIHEKEFTNYFLKIDSEFNLNSYGGYYCFREFFNKNLWKTNSKEEAFAIIILSSYCINNMYRFGKNGFNSSVGISKLFNYSIVEASIKKVQSLKEKIYLYNDCFNCLNIDGALYFIDPPYFKAEMANNGNWEINDLEKLFKNSNFKNNIIYTDIKNEIGDKYFNNNIKLDQLKNISPSRKNETIHDERCYFNF